MNTSVEDLKGQFRWSLSEAIRLSLIKNYEFGGFIRIRYNKTDFVPVFDDCDKKFDDVVYEVAVNQQPVVHHSVAQIEALVDEIMQQAWDKGGVIDEDPLEKIMKIRYS